MTESLRNVDAFYEIPINTYDTTLGFHFRKNQSEVIEEPFDLLDIKSNSLSVGTTLRHPLYRSLHH
ncbi:MAG: ShlB/FhaC/HecB family hemolysin secretion/activation protein, partial [Nitrospinaceae bacterium]|nr:ShlB/FhaC/HecB family hemolysin secretion/activation protein [Nitrospinaceae bacterium]NIR53463.1 ShlB/FhaC/HecB family hemolysin secretion/activation protein [Nitrospinaceae bacterium]NIT80659.1 ShlB/FhaC/HecB family hemolysin secretion/activation protein [Nitrospinaceae bacterium]NIX33063.1 ShlB/FhaC/HecB family hemolysin secretion/activation protein [Nitrospinaceae bacterium]NIY13683.1 ShlB/FhaC/HecB family hemolysin secretion/activation protein [Nitrospinaceae bacterium]